MKEKAPLVLRGIRRGQGDDGIELITTTSDVLLLHAHGVHRDDQLRVREQALKLLTEAVAR
jgi:hypothetical protein